MQVVKLIVFSIVALDNRMKRIQTHAHWRQFLLGSTFCSCYLPEPVGRSYFEKSNLFTQLLHGTNILHTARIGMSCVAYVQWNKCDGIFLSLENK